MSPSLIAMFRFPTSSQVRIEDFGLRVYDFLCLPSSIAPL